MEKDRKWGLTGEVEVDQGRSGYEGLTGEALLREL